jgi:N-acetylglucosamine repressor
MATVSDFWRRKVLSVLYGRGATTRSELVTATALNVASVSLVLRELIDFGVVRTLGKRNSSGGRKSEILRLNPEAAYFLAVELDGRRNRFGLVNLAGDVRFRWEEPCDPACVPVERVAAGIRRILENLSSSELSRTIAIGISYTGWLNPEGELTAVNLGWENVPIARTLESLVNFPVFLASDCALKALVEHSMGRAQGAKNYLHISMDSGLGVGCFVDGRLLRGAHGMAGEFGHITIDPAATDPCRCGKRGCLESIVSSTSILRQYAERSGAAHGALSAIAVFDRARDGEPAAREVIDRVGRYLGLGISHLVNLLDPELIVLGGDLIDGADLFIPRIQEQLSKHALPPFVEGIEIKTSSLGQDIALKGAASLAFRQSLQTPALLKQVCSPVLSVAEV